MICPDREALLTRVVDAGERAPDSMAVDHLRTCAVCRGHVEELESLVRTVSSERPLYSSPDRRSRIFARAVSSSRGGSAESKWSWSLAGWALGSVTLASAALLMWSVAPSAVDDGFRARGATGESEEHTPGGVADAADWVGLYAFVKRDGEALAAGEILADDALLFSYTNLGPSPMRWLAIIGLDAAGAIHWYHPPNTSERSSMRVQTGVSHYEIQEAVRMPLAAGTLSIVGVFSRVPIERQRLEAWVQAGQTASTSPDREVVVKTLSLKVSAASK